jgi:hypothetical protein
MRRSSLEGQGKHVFFWKKEPKNFCELGLALPGQAAAENNQKSFADIFKKRRPFFTS